MTPTAAAAGHRPGHPSGAPMGIFDDIKKAIRDVAEQGQAPQRGPAASRAPHSPPPREPSVPASTSAAHQALKAAQDKRRQLPLTRLKTGKPLSQYRLARYEHLERILVMKAGAFPLDEERIRAALRSGGFDAAHVDAYLRSDAARRLLS